MAEIDPVAQERRLRAKRQNERLKLLVGFLNTVGLAILGAVFVIPGVSSLTRVQWTWVCVGIGPHVVAQAVLQRLRSEE